MPNVKVLLIEDEPIIAEELQSALKEKFDGSGHLSLTLDSIRLVLGFDQTALYSKTYKAH